MCKHIVSLYPRAVVGDGAAPGQAGVEVRDAIRAADRSVLVDLAAAVHVATASQVSVGQGEGRTAETNGRGRLFTERWSAPPWTHLVHNYDNF